MDIKNERISRIKRIIRASLGLIVCGFGTYLTIQANIGLAPWEAFNMGFSYIIHSSYGTATIILSAIIILIDILMKERIGYGTILDAIIVGKAVDFFDYLDIIPKQNSLVTGIILMLIGLFIVSYACYFYMSAALCCGPRDMLLVAIGKRFRKVPIGYVTMGLLMSVVAVGFLLGAPIGIGTLISVFGLGSALQFAFKTMHYEPRDTVHEDMIATTKVLVGGKIRAGEHI